MAKQNEHVILNAGRGGLLLCLHCGESYEPAMPAPMDVYAAMLKTFGESHARCKVGEKGLACLYCSQFGHEPKDCKRLQNGTPQEWLDGPDTGLSSVTICRTLLGMPVNRPTVPLDPDDFGRCHRLLQRFPEFRPRIGEVAEKFSMWAPLVREWAEMEALFEEESPSGRCPKLYKRMKALLAEAGW